MIAFVGLQFQKTLIPKETKCWQLQEKERKRVAQLFSSIVEALGCGWFSIIPKGSISCLIPRGSADFFFTLPRSHYEKLENQIETEEMH